jgi:RNA polymerase sigma-70 factor, ECF subfamily
VPDRGDSVSGLLARWREGDQEALSALIPIVYKELRTLAHNHLRAERQGHTFQSVDLVHEAFLRLVDQAPETQDRKHFVAVASRLMRQILVDYARSRAAAKRGPEQKVLLDEALDLPEQQRPVDVIALNDALTELARHDPQQVQIVEMRFFGGLTLDEAADVLGVSVATVKRDWSMAKAWLVREMRDGRDGHDGTVGAR